jgi:hypothetical protein
MSKILGPGETGYGILIEHDAGYISKDLNKKILTENFQLKENVPVLINCVLQKWGVENKNGRVYPEDVLVPQVQEYQKLVDSNSAVSEADHPESSIISLNNVSHRIVKMWWGEGDKSHVLFGQIQLIVTPGYINMGIASMVGDKIVQYLRDGIKLGISSRGVGTLKEIDGKNLVQGDFELIGFDLVATPSTPGAYLFPGVQNVEHTIGENFVKKNGLYIKEESDKIINSLDKFLL